MTAEISGRSRKNGENLSSEATASLLPPWCCRQFWIPLQRNNNVYATDHLRTIL